MSSCPRRRVQTLGLSSLGLSWLGLSWLGLSSLGLSWLGLFLLGLSWFMVLELEIKVAYILRNSMFEFRSFHVAEYKGRG